MARGHSPSTRSSVFHIQIKRTTHGRKELLAEFCQKKNMDTSSRDPATRETRDFMIRRTFVPAIQDVQGGRGRFDEQVLEGGGTRGR